MIKLARMALPMLLSICATYAFAEDAKTQSGDAYRGAKLFRQRCAGCHINQGKGDGGRGPNLTDIVDGRPTHPAFKYTSNIVIFSWIWSVDRLDNYLQNPNLVVPRATMASQVRNKLDRVDIIAYLKTLRSPEGHPPARGSVVRF